MVLPGTYGLFLQRYGVSESKILTFGEVTNAENIVEV